MNWFNIKVHALIIDVSLKLIFANAFLNPIFYGLCRSNYRKGYVYVAQMACSVLTCGIVIEKPGGMLKTGPWFNIKISSYQYRKSRCGDKTVVRSSYLHNWISYTGKIISLYWFSPLVFNNASWLTLCKHLKPLSIYHVGMKVLSVNAMLPRESKLYIYIYIYQTVCLGHDIGVVFWHNFCGMKRTCWTTSNWRRCLSLGVRSSIPSWSTMIYRLHFGLYTIPRASRLKKNVYPLQWIWPFLTLVLRSCKGNATTLDYMPTRMTTESRFNIKTVSPCSMGLYIIGIFIPVRLSLCWNRQLMSQRRNGIGYQRSCFIDLVFPEYYLPRRTQMIVVSDTSLFWRHYDHNCIWYTTIIVLSLLCYVLFGTHT